MSEELRPCPFCGGTKICTEKGINLNYCDNCSAESNIEHWNTRPIEDALQARIAELEGEVDILKDQQREAKNILIDKKLHIDSLYEEGYKLQQRIAELEGIIKSDDERLTEAGLKVNLYFGCDTAEIMAEEILSSRARIAELEEQNKALEAACEILRSDNSILFKRLMAIKTPNNTKKNTIVYRREGEEW